MKLRVVQLALCGILLLTAACKTVAPAPDAPEMKSSNLIGKKEAETVINKDWWKQFKSDELNRLIADVASSNLDLANLVTSARIAAESVANSRKDGLPRFTASTSGTSSVTRTDGVSTRSNTGVAELGFVWEADIWGALKSKTEAELNELKATEADYRATYLFIVSNVAQSYIRLRQFDEQQQIHKESLKRSEQILKIYKAREKHGRSTIEEVRFQEAEILRLKNEVEELRKQRQLELHFLANLIGKTPGSIEIPPLKLRGHLAIFPLPEDLTVNLLERRPDIVAADLRLKKAYYLSESASAALLPRVTFGGSTSISKAATSPVTWISSIIPSITFPSLDADAQTAAKVKKLEIDIATNNYKKAVNTALKETLDALANYHSHNLQKSNEEKRVKKLREAHQKVMIRFNAGRTSRLELLDSERQLLNAEQAELEQHSRILQDMVMVYTALGGGW